MPKRVTKVTVRAPATTANMGPGFDSIGMALGIFNTISVELANSFELSIYGEGADVLSGDTDNMVYRGFCAAIEKTDTQVPAVRLTCHNDIPLKRGLGSSAAAVTGGIIAGQIMSGKTIPPEELIKLADGIEGHPDNVAAALFGGCQVIVRDGDKLVSTSLPVDSTLSAVLLIPDFEILTEDAREVLPKAVSLTDAVHNVSRAALLTASLATGKLDALRLATQDALHQPARESLFPAMRNIFQAALDAGAHGVFLSGSGPTVLALASADHEKIGQAMLEESRRAHIDGRVRLTSPSSSGVTVVDAEVGEY